MRKSKPGWPRLGLEHLEDRLVPNACNWIGGNSNNSFFDPNNWQGGQVPGAADTVILGVNARSPNHCPKCSSRRGSRSAAAVRPRLREEEGDLEDVFLGITKGITN